MKGTPLSCSASATRGSVTFLLSQGFGLEDVKNLLGHSTIVLTSNTYGHVLEQRQEEMARGMDAALGG
jgi:site-specific recombinase XerD